jgi:hypothetical protein
MMSNRYEAIDPITGLPICFEPYVPKPHLLQRLADDDVQETPEGLFYRGENGGLVYAPDDIPPLQASDDRRAAALTGKARQAHSSS